MDTAISQQTYVYTFCQTVDFYVLNSLSERLKPGQILTVDEHEQIIDLIEKVRNLAIQSGVAEDYVHPDPEYRIVRWPESQDYMENHDDSSQCFPINDDYGLATYGPAAYFVHESYNHETERQDHPQED